MVVDEKVVGLVDSDISSGLLTSVEDLGLSGVVSVTVNWFETNRISSIATASSVSIPQ